MGLGSLNLFPRAFPFWWAAKSPGNAVGVACVLCVNKTADSTLSSEDEEIENSIIARKQQLAKFVNQIVTLTVELFVSSHLESRKVA